MKSSVSWRVVKNTSHVDVEVIFTKVLMTICSVFAAIGYVLIGNGLYDEAIKHFSLLLQVCFMWPNLLQTVTLAGSWMSSNQEYFLFMFCAFDAGWSRAGQCHLRQRYSIWKEKSTGEWWVASFQFHIFSCGFMFFFFDIFLFFIAFIRSLKILLDFISLYFQGCLFEFQWQQQFQVNTEWLSVTFSESQIQSARTLRLWKCALQKKKRKSRVAVYVCLAFCGYVPSLAFLSFFLFWLTLF